MYQNAVTLVPDVISCNWYDPVSRDQILRRKRGEGNINFPCSVDHEQDWQPYPVDPYSAMCNERTYSRLSLSGVTGDTKRRGRPGILPAIFSPSHKGPPTILLHVFFRPRNFHIFVVVLFVLPFAIKNGLSERLLAENSLCESDMTGVTY